MSAASILSLRIYDLELRDDGWHAVVVMAGQSRQVDRTCGSWRVTPQTAPDGALARRWAHVRPNVAAELQRAVRRLEKAGTVSVPRTKEDSTMSAATKAKPSKAAKAKPKAAAKPKPAKAKTNRGKASKAKGAAKMSRAESRKRQDDALKMHDAGKSYKEIMEALGFANPGHTYNSVVAAKKRRDAK